MHLMTSAAFASGKHLQLEHVTLGARGVQNSWGHPEHPADPFVLVLLTTGLVHCTWLVLLRCMHVSGLQQ
jgi:hypothetical protein